MLAIIGPAVADGDGDDPAATTDWALRPLGPAMTVAKGGALPRLRRSGARAASRRERPRA